MAHVTMNQYLQQIDEALQHGRGKKAAELLSCKHAHSASSRLHVDDPEPSVQRVMDSPWDEVVCQHLRCLYHMNNYNFVDAYKEQAILVQLFTKIFQSLKEENWALPIMYTVCLDLRLFASQADTQLSKKSKGKPGETLEKAAELLMGCFRVCASDNRSSLENSKRRGMLNLVNQLFKIYFKINKLHLCKPLIRAIESSALKDHFSISQLVTYRYYVGQKAMFDSDFKNAEEYLTFAFLRCDKDSVRNKRLILIYLIPVKMLLGHMPSEALLCKYDLMQFSEVVSAVTEGNLMRLDKALASNEEFFIRCGIYLILERLKVITYRNLFKKVYLLLKTHQIPIEAFLVALKFMKVDDVDMDELQCIIANLIYEGKIKGYISLQHQKLVVSKQSAFPRLSSLT
uniref:PCI domain-containing protein 2 homolog n=1 Tax=Amblyomma sculptum TaxID=1581419 RepID=A0A1E1XSS8_AMBSC